MRNKRWYTAGLLVLLMACGCSNSTQGMTEPSVKYCLEHGHKAQPVTRDGIPQSYLCINVQSGKKCDSWAYFKGQCDLDTPQ